MLARLFACLLVGLALAGPISYAQPSPTAFQTAIANTVQGFTLNEIIQWSDAQFARTASVGRYVRWGGSIVIGSALVAAGLDYFYNYLRSQTGTSLDSWQNSGQALQVVAACLGTSQYDRNVACDYVVVYDQYSCEQIAEYPRQLGLSFAAILQQYATGTYLPSGGLCQGPGTTQRTFGPSIAVPLQRQTLPDFLRSNPDAAEGVKQAVVRYINDHAPNSPSNPYPGVRLDPPPNPNQWTDNPYTRPDIDTDGDGWPDSIESKEAVRRHSPIPDLVNDPNQHPDPDADPDGDGWSTADEVKYGTDPYDPSSHPSARNPSNAAPDTDGDGWPDDVEIASGTDPNDPNSHPDGDPPQTDDTWPGGPGRVQPGRLDLPSAPAEDLRPLPEVEPFWAPFQQQVLDRWNTEVSTIRNTASHKFPFGIVSILSPHVSTDGAECSFPLPIAHADSRIDICSTPIWQTAASFRPILLGLLYLSFAYLLVRRALDVQR